MGREQIGVDDLMSELESLGSEQTVRIYRNHGADGPMFGVKVGDLKKILKRIRGDQELAMALWDTGNSDAMYLAGLLADGSRMTRRQLNHWAKTAWWYMLSEYSVPFVAAEHPDAGQIAMRWMAAKPDNVQSSGWATYAAMISTRPDDQLDLAEITGLLERVEQQIDTVSDRVRYVMNGFVIAVGSYVTPLLGRAKQTARRIGKVGVTVGNTSCKVPVATDAIAKVEQLGRVGQKRRSVKC